MEQVGITGLSPESEPSPKALAEVADLAVLPYRAGTQDAERAVDAAFARVAELNAIIRAVAAKYSVMFATFVLFAGFCMSGAQTGMNAFAPSCYPTAVRATGVSWMLGIGRFGSISGSFLGGMLLTMGWGFSSVISILAIPATIAAIAIIAATLMHGAPGRDVAMTAALLADIGRMLMHRYRMSTTDRHAEVGAYLLSTWGMPDSLVDLVRQHHSPRWVDDAAMRELITATHIAVCVANAEACDSGYLLQLGNRADALLGLARQCLAQTTAIDGERDRG